MAYGAPPLLGDVGALPAAPLLWSLAQGQALGQTIINKQPGQAAFYDFSFQHQGPATTVYVRALMQDQINSVVYDLQKWVAVNLPSAASWRTQMGRLNFTIPSTMPPSTYYPWIRVCEPLDCTRQSVYGWNLGIWISLGSGAGQVAIAAPMILAMG